MYFSNKHLINFLMIIFRRWGKFLTLSWKQISGSIVKIAFYISRGTLWGNQFMWRKESSKNIFRILDGHIFGLFSENFPARFPKLDSTCPDNCFEEVKFLWERKSIWMFVYQRLAFLFGFLTKKLFRLAKMAIYLSGGNLR